MIEVFTRIVVHLWNMVMLVLMVVAIAFLRMDMCV